MAILRKTARSISMVQISFFDNGSTLLFPLLVLLFSSIIALFPCCDARVTYLDFRAQRRCNWVLRKLNIKPLLDCVCTADRELLGGKITTVSCSQSDLVDAFCTPLFCGSINWSVSFGAGRGLDRGSICIETNSVVPESLPDFCIEAVADRDYFFRFESCTVDIPDESCTCTVCDSGVAFTLECTNRPTVECIGLY